MGALLDCLCDEDELNVKKEEILKENDSENNEKLSKNKGENTTQADNTCVKYKKISKLQITNEKKKGQNLLERSSKRNYKFEDFAYSAQNSCKIDFNKSNRVHDVFELDSSSIDNLSGLPDVRDPNNNIEFCLENEGNVVEFSYLCGDLDEGKRRYKTNLKLQREENTHQIMSNVLDTAKESIRFNLDLNNIKNVQSIFSSGKSNSNQCLSPSVTDTRCNSNCRNTFLSGSNIINN